MRRTDFSEPETYVIRSALDLEEMVRAGAFGHQAFVGVWRLGLHVSWHSPAYRARAQFRYLMCFLWWLCGELQRKNSHAES